MFLSYASDDGKKVQDLYDSLSRNGLDVWLDRHALQPAEPWDRLIQEAIRSSKAFVVCISKTWLRRPKNSYVKKEYLMALREAERRRKRYLFPVLIETCRIPKSLPFQTTTLIGADRATKVNRFALTLRSGVEGPKQSPPRRP